MKTETNTKDNSSISGLAFAACMFIGAGIGALCNATQIGGALGMGAGFIAMILIKLKNK